MEDKTKCPACENTYKGIGQHWSHYESHRPEFSDYQIDIITGLMMSDGSLNRKNKNPYFTVSMIRRDYIEWLNDVFGVLSTGVKMQRSAQEQADSARASGFTTVVNDSNYHDLWKVRIRSHPILKIFDWYEGKEGKKVWPKDIELSPTVLTHLYVGDGHWSNGETNDHISIGAANERGNVDKIDSYFDRAGLPKPSNYQTSSGMEIVFNKDESYELFEYMERPPPGFEYKFPEEYR